MTLTRRRQQQCRPGRPLRRRPLVAPRRGTVLAMSIWVILILAAMVMVYAASMRVELSASGNRVAAESASAVQRGAEQYVRARVDVAEGNAREVTRAPAEAVLVGDANQGGGYFWIIRPTVGRPAEYEFGITDESSKLNVNAADAADLAKLPGVTQELGFAILDWRDDDKTIAGPGGAETEYYLTLPEPYQCKDKPLETIDEMLLIKGVNQTVLYGDDRNRNGAAADAWPVGPGAGAAAERPMAAKADADQRGIAPFVTVSSVERNTDAKGNARVNVTSDPGNGGGGKGNPAPAPGTPPGGNGNGNGNGPTRRMAQDQPGVVVTPNPGGQGQPGKPGQGGGQQENAALRDMLTKTLEAGRANQIMSVAGGGPFQNAFDFGKKGKLSADEFDQVFDKLTHSDDKTLVGRINVNTAPREVLRCIPGLEDDDVSALLDNRPMNPSGCGWVLEALEPGKLAGPAGTHMTGRSVTYSADIVAVSGDGRAFKRERIVVDGRQSPPVIVRRQDLTNLGWPLGDALRQQLRSGIKPEVAFKEVPAQGASGNR